MTDPSPTPRRDAARNRARIVDAAREAFTAHGLDVPLDTVAKTAGVGAGTLYRHFPTREDLVAAVLEEHRVDLARERDQIRAAAPQPVDALERWLDALAAWMRTYEGLPGPLRTALDATGTPLGTTCDDVIATTDAFLAPVRDDGLARADLDGRTLYVAVLGLTWGAANSPRVDGPSLLTLLRSGWAIT